jgi:c-di-GMP-binding flagellar brake protein YcgR
MESSNQESERRKYPRFSLDLPLEYRATSAPNVRGALVINASESGLLVHSIKEMAVGTKLKILVMFPEEYQLDNFEVLAEVVWKDIQWEENWEGYQLGLKFINLLEEDYLKLKQLLSNGHEIG